MTLAAFGDLAEAPAGFLELVIRGLDEFAAGAFPVRFDRIECRKATTLRSSTPLAAACAAAKWYSASAVSRTRAASSGPTRRAASSKEIFSS